MIREYFGFVFSCPVRGLSQGAGILARRAMGRSAFKDRRPWIVCEAETFLNVYLSSLRDTPRVFEYGCGGSTLYLADKLRVLDSAFLHSVEHDAGWGRVVQDELEKEGSSHATVQVLEPENIDRSKKIESRFFSDVSDYQNQSFEKYVTSIRAFDDHSFDLVTVDGRCRNACVIEAISKVKKGGMLMLDNSEREKYEDSIELLKGYKRKTFYGLNPYQLYPGETSFWEIT